jgi:hypothetical protein
MVIIPWHHVRCAAMMIPLMPKKSEFETDSDGNIITNPVTGWVSSTFAEMGIILALHYAPTPQALESGKNSSIQFVLTPQQCLELAERLTKLAHIVLDQPLPEKPAN